MKLHNPLPDIFLSFFLFFFHMTVSCLTRRCGRGREKEKEKEIQKEKGEGYVVVYVCT